MWAGPLRCGRVPVLLVVALFMPVLARAELCTVAEEAGTSCSRGDAAGGSGHMALLQQQVSKPKKVLPNHAEASTKSVEMLLQQRVSNLKKVSRSRAGVSAMSHVNVSAKTHVKMAPLSVSFVSEGASMLVTGNAAALDAEGYSKVMQLTSQFQTTNFVLRLVHDMALKVVGEDSFRGYILSLNKDSDFNGIRWMLQHQTEEPCGWLAVENKNIDIDGSSAPLNEEGYRKVLDLRNTYEMYLFAKRVIEAEGLHMSKHKGKLHGMLSFYNCENGFQSFDRMRDELREVAESEHGWLRKEAQDFKEETGESAPFTEEGYRAVYDLCSISELFTYARRVIDNEGLRFSGEDGKLNGMLEFYGCEKGIKSLDRLKTELRNIAALPDGWLQTGDA